MKTILVVDDSATIRAAIRRILEPMGYQVREASDGAQALEYCRAHQDLDAILLDIDMPVLDGIGFLAQLRESGGAQPPVVMCTAHNSIGQIERALSAGASEYIMKPFDADILGLKLAEIGIA
ncbi:MAG TPA: response regulator [Longimicrobiaceae bacterium]|jgi:two-component system chemotaxis response regulator CheY|nr:response regulator [Longimicrobiaceae bacterium]